MNRIFITVLMLFLPGIALATDGSLSFTPPPTDYSVIFLENIFGIVDGVLHGTGSQIMGNMFGVFNAAVLAIGGIVVMYTLIVGTMNTAHEGQMLGQKWSSIWIPVRATIGLAFLIPKSSGYCLMQIFIMWVVVQGVGAADKIWNSALDYLNRGGAIVKAQQSMNSTTTSKNNDAIVDIMTGEQVILSGQVCMKGIQTLLETQRKTFLQTAESDSGPCSPSRLSKSDADPDMVYFCKNEVPDFISTVNAIDKENENFISSCDPDYSSSDSGGNLKLKMPNFSDGIYAKLNGICGKIKWAEFDPDLSGSSTLSCSDVDTTRQSRAVAVQQIYSDLTPVAIEMVDNDPEINPDRNADTSTYYSAVAKNQFGVPLLDTGNYCSSPSSKCVGWGAEQSSTNQTLVFSGFELQNAFQDYNGIMLPALNLIQQQKDSDQANNLKKFIKGSEEQGWIMAGAYFFNLVYLNGLVTTNDDLVDDSSKLGKSKFDVDDFASVPFDNQCTTLCTFFDRDSSKVQKLVGLINGSSIGETVQPSVSTDAVAVTDNRSSTTYGFVNNGALVHEPGQPGLNTPDFNINFNIQPGQTLLAFPKKSFSCGSVFGYCIGRFLADAFYNDIFRGIMNVFMSFITSVYNLMLQTFLYVPLDALMMTFNEGVQLLETTMIHPIVALAYMGAAFINASVDIWLNLISFSIIFGTITFGLAYVAIFLVLPFLASWMGVMVGVGWIDAYYAPFIPYMIFTFGTIAWLMAVIESMVAGPIVALGVTHPEGHDALGKAEQSMMILVNIFLRPAIMIIGYIGSISLSYVTVFILNSGFVQIMQFLLPSGGLDDGWTSSSSWSNVGSMDSEDHTHGAGTPYTNWAAIYASFFCLVTYTSLYLTVVQKSFTLIHTLPDKILRWIGSQGESYGQDTAQWSEDSKGQVKDTGQETGKSSMKSGGSVMGMVEGMTGMGSSSSTSGSSSAT